MPWFQVDNMMAFPEAPRPGEADELVDAEACSMDSMLQGAKPKAAPVAASRFKKSRRLAFPMSGSSSLWRPKPTQDEPREECEVCKHCKEQGQADQKAYVKGA